MNVEIIDIVPSLTAAKRDGGTYEAFSISYKNSRGYQEQMLKPAVMIRQNQPLHAKLTALSAGDKVELVFEKSGMYKNLIDVIPVTEVTQTASPPSVATTTKKESYKSTFVDNSVGMQVGNALNNAAVLIANKVVKGTVQMVAEDILRIGERLKANLVAGKYNIAITPVANDATATVIEEEINFSDE